MKKLKFILLGTIVIASFLGCVLIPTVFRAARAPWLRFAFSGCLYAFFATILYWKNRSNRKHQSSPAAQEIASAVQMRRKVTPQSIAQLAQRSNDQAD